MGMLLQDSYIAILHGNEEEPHAPIVTTTSGGAYIERDLGTAMRDACATCGNGGNLVRRMARYEWTERHPAPAPFKEILVARLVEVREQKWL